MSRQHKVSDAMGAGRVLGELRGARLAWCTALPLLSLVAALGCKFDRDANTAHGCEGCNPPDRCISNFCVRGNAAVPPPEAGSTAGSEAPPPEAGSTAGTEAPPQAGSTAAGTEAEPPCEPGSRELCYEGPENTDQNPPCRFGSKTCSAEGVLGPCRGQVLPEDETCNNADDDCDGTTDEQLMRDARVCKEGKFVCPPTPSVSVAEACDGADNDCDDKTDEGFDLAADPANCGACGKTCAQNEVCCDGECADTESDESHCGQCGKACRNNTTCCGGGCVDTTSDASHCGACGMRCAGGRSCCDSQCVDTQTDRNHCGANCLNCGVGQECCFGNCADLSTHQHCGSCERACSDAELCCDQQCTTGACPQ